MRDFVQEYSPCCTSKGSAIIAHNCDRCYFCRGQICFIEYLTKRVTKRLLGRFWDVCGAFVSHHIYRGKMMGTKRYLLIAAHVLILLAAGTMITSANPILVAEVDGGNFAYDTLQNTSNLTDEQILRLLDEDRYDELKYLLDRDKDGIADGTEVEVIEFIERISIVIATKAYVKTYLESRKPDYSPGQI